MNNARVLEYDASDERLPNSDVANEILHRRVE